VWRNPKEVIGDPKLARLQQGRKELTEEEKADVKKYGYTGLELMTYVHANQFPGAQDYDLFYRRASVDGTGIVKVTILNRRWKYYYKDYRSLLTYDGIKPGDIVLKRPGFVMEPSKERGTTFHNVGYLRSKDNYREETTNMRPITLKRIRSSVARINRTTFTARKPRRMTGWLACRGRKTTEFSAKIRSTGSRASSWKARCGLSPITIFPGA
jgi:hypothetical protein